MKNEYPPNNPDGGIWVYSPYDSEQLAVTGADSAYWLLLIATVLIFLGIWAILHVGKKSDRHHKDT
jgi:LPXTG-motif cell wall-anchored protein